MKRLNRVILDVFEDETTGSYGLGVVGMPRDETTNAATDGVLLAHDLIEHVNGPEAIGTITDELEALGAIWYARGQWGDLRRDGVGSAYTAEENIASDVSRMFRDFFNGAHVDLSRPRTMPLCGHDDAFREIVTIAQREALSELDEEDREKADTQANLNAYLAVCVPRMRIGFRKAQRKYGPHGRFTANSLFWSIADAVEPYAKKASVYEGYQFELCYGLRDNEVFAHCTEYFSEDY